jgi:hypothetical protein
MSYRDGGRMVMDTILGMLQDKVVVEVPPKMEGRQMTMILMAAKAAKKSDAGKPKSPPAPSAPKEAPKEKTE